VGNLVATFWIQTGEDARPEKAHYTGAVPRPTRRDIDALWGPATPQFAYQIAGRLQTLIQDLPADDPVRRYGMERLHDLDRLAQGTTKGAEPGH
jgi:hypothetical protein